MTNPAIRPQPNGDVDISVDEATNEATDDTAGESTSETGVDAAHADNGPGPEPTVDPANLDHPEELMGE